MVIFSQCLDCKNYKGKDADDKHFCKAFPEGIPEEIFWNKTEHNESIEGDNGITFEPLTD